MPKFKQLQCREPNNHGRTPEQFIRELQSRLHYRYMQTNGSYELPFDDPYLFDVLSMIVNYEPEDNHKPGEQKHG